MLEEMTVFDLPGGPKDSDFGERNEETWTRTSIFLIIAYMVDLDKLRVRMGCSSSSEKCFMMRNEIIERHEDEGTLSETYLVTNL